MEIPNKQYKIGKPNRRYELMVEIAGELGRDQKGNKYAPLRLMGKFKGIPTEDLDYHHLRCQKEKDYSLCIFGGIKPRVDN